jgi:DNA invertase Pin-like site-specific DNA recombinase
VDNPHATRLTLHILAAVAEHEREMIAERTKAALQAAKARGIRLGRNGADRLAPAYRAQALERAWQLFPVLDRIKTGWHVGTADGGGANRGAFNAAMMARLLCDWRRAATAMGRTRAINRRFRQNIS